jgi:hypothetical protein
MSRSILVIDTWAPNGADRSAVYDIPESDSGRMPVTPSITVGFDRRLVRSVVLRREIPPSADTTGKAERKIGDLAEGAGRLLGMPERSSDLLIGVIVGSTGRIVARPGIEFRLLP